MSVSEMSWNPQIDVHYMGPDYPYDSSRSFMEYFEGLTYEHASFIFNADLHCQDNRLYALNENSCKPGIYQPWDAPYCNNPYGYFSIDNSAQRNDDDTVPLEYSTVFSEQTSIVRVGEENHNMGTIDNHDSEECLRRQQIGQDYQISQVAGQDNVDLDIMTYEELLEIGEAIGTQSRGLSLEFISLLPVTKYKRCFFLRRKSRTERCVICQMEYKRGVRRITLPCKHNYHVGCGTKWLSINKACPICYVEVFGDASKNLR